jgi:predicted CxxxxCH...CXXCH cytochrome family protein
MNRISFITICVILALAIFSCSEKKDITDVGAHPEAWSNASSEEFHGNAVIEGGNESCTSCHGTDFMGGSSGASCYGSSCHAVYPHPEGFSNISAEMFHGNYLKTELTWDMGPCKNCHGDNYERELSGVSCRSCHTGSEGPEECNTCHGSPSNIAPPKDLNGNVRNDSLGVGAHQIHVAETMVTNVYDCAGCHPNIVNFDDPNHIDDGIAEIIFNSLATDDGRLIPEWDRTAGTCSDVYCHGAFEFGNAGQIVGNSDPVIWTDKVANPEACVFCHSLPPQGHFGQGQYNTPGSCAQCHGSVVNANGEIINPSLHINGLAN